MLADFQNALVGLALDAELRRQFRADAGSALAQFQLDARERHALTAIAPADLERFALSLVAKRWDEVVRMVPLTLRVAPSLATRYRRWALAHPMRVADALSTVGLPPSLAAALPAEAALAIALHDEAEAEYASDLWCYEIRGAASRFDGGVRILRSRFALEQIVADVAAGCLPTEPLCVATEIRFDGKGVQWRRR